MGEFINSLGDFCLHTAESCFVIIFQGSKLQICTGNKVLGASEELFSNVKLTVKVSLGINTEGYYKAEERDSPVKIAGLKVHAAMVVA